MITPPLDIERCQMYTPGRTALSSRRDNFSRVSLVQTPAATSCLSVQGPVPAIPHQPTSSGEGCPLQYGPKRQQVPIWQCCTCGQAAMPIRADPCRNCGTPRCAYCPVTKVRVRMNGHDGLLGTEADEEGVFSIEEGVQVVAEHKRE
ncbi:hypothetical protein LY76DRAFT_688533 [Colletotrichum caudatum]|nr:hypothetical protein LY76DRAFT_688533 [Colletotrichum caudatum]